VYRICLNGSEIILFLSGSVLVVNSRIHIQDLDLTCLQKAYISYGNQLLKSLFILENKHHSLNLESFKCKVISVEKILSLDRFPI
jgi:hypothetical protein